MSFYTPIPEISKTRDALLAGFHSGKSRDIAFRKTQLLQLAYMIQDNAKALTAALYSDLGRPEQEAGFLELNGTIGEAINAYENVAKWAKDEKAPFQVNFFALGPRVRKEPKGVVLIIGPFNYPIWCTLSPMAGAIAAGNAVVLKPSEMTPAVSTLLAELFPKYLDSSLYRIVNGGVAETSKLLDLQWDHIFYTGSGRVGRIVATAAAKHLTPVSLELGGKSPVFIDPKTDLKLAARRILWGRTANAGQTCVAPDYVMVPKEGEAALAAAFAEAHREFYPDAATAPASIARIVSPEHYARLKGLLDNSRGRIVAGGPDACREQEKYIAPTIVSGVTKDDPLMQGEIFGPILPIMPVESVDAGIEFVNAHDKPLALYVFSDDAKFKSKVFDNTQSGACAANETLIHCAVDGLPFGGTGPSGSGYHTGRYSFAEFTHLRATLDAPKWFDMMLKPRYPPYTDKKLKQLAKFAPKIKYARPGEESGTPWGKLLGGLALVLGIVGAWRSKAGQN